MTDLKILIIKFSVLFIAFLSVTFPAVAASGCGGAAGNSQPIRSQEMQIPQKRGGILAAKIFAPSRQSEPCPLISILPGGGAGIDSVAWAAEKLAAAGYIVILTKPEFGLRLDSYNTAVVSGIDFMLSPANPYLKDTKTDSIGIAGWSLGGRVLSRTQEEDLRIDALVAWDNLAVSETGDDGSPLCRNQPQVIRKARVPALGQSSDGCFGKSAEAKKTAFEHWRASKTPAMQVVFKGANHFFWSARARESQHEIAHYYTLAWFDRWLKGDRSASERLLARTVLGNGLENLLSSTYHSGAFFDGYDCNDLREPCRKK